jgi:hypothetical protein
MSWCYNTNTGKIHEWGCRAIDMMRDDHKQEAYSLAGDPCGWCKPTGNEFQSRVDEQDSSMGISFCHEHAYLHLFAQTGCLSCGSKAGVVKKMPHDGGIPLKDETGKWWVFFECDKCHYQTAWWKAEKRLEVMRTTEIIMERE